MRSCQVGGIVYDNIHCHLLSPQQTFAWLGPLTRVVASQDDLWNEHLIGVMTIMLLNFLGIVSNSSVNFWATGGREDFKFNHEKILRNQR